jgi:hypothetical protein
MENFIGYNQEEKYWEYEVDGVNIKLRSVGGSRNKPYADKTFDYELELGSIVDCETIKAWLYAHHRTGIEWYSDKIERFYEISPVKYKYTLRKPSTE